MREVSALSTHNYDKSIGRKQSFKTLFGSITSPNFLLLQIGGNAEAFDSISNTLS